VSTCTTPRPCSYLGSYLAGLLLACPLAAQHAKSAIHSSDEVILFTSLRETIVRPVVAPFERGSGMAVRIMRAARPRGPAETKVLVERFTRARADVWWCQETLATDALKRAGAFGRMEPPPVGADAIARRFHDRDGLWFGFAARARIIIVNAAHVPENLRPHSMWDLLDPCWKGKVALTRPSSGTALFHLLALQETLGAADTERFLEGLSKNDCKIAASDRRLAEMIANGDALVGMTDTSDWRGVKARGKPVDAIYPDQDGVGTLVIPNTVARLAASGNPAGARRLVEYLLSEQGERIIAQQDRGQFPLRAGAAHTADIMAAGDLRVMKVDLGDVAALADTFGAQLRKRYAGLQARGGLVDRPTGTVLVDFDQMATGKPPAGMTVAQTGSGAMGVWTVAKDPTSRGGGRVVTQTDTTGSGRRFPLCLHDGPAFRDASVSVCFKTMTGDTDRAAGICVRYIDQDNYYCCRVNSLEDNYRFYKVVDGRRMELGGVNHLPILENTWQSMRLDVKGDHFRMWMNGALIFEVDDGTFPGPGKVGLWLKGDSVTSFDDLTISPPGSRHASDFENERPGAEPRGFMTRSDGDDKVSWRIVPTAGAAKGGLAVTPEATQHEGARRRGGCVLLDGANVARNVSVFTRFKVATTGPGMHLAGLVARYQDANHHYHLRINPEECNLRLYRVSNGKRTLVGERHHTRHDEHVWHTAQLTATGTRFSVLIDGEVQFVTHDDGLPAAGRAGVWAAPGGNTLYDEIVVEAFD